MNGIVASHRNGITGTRFNVGIVETFEDGETSVDAPTKKFLMIQFPEQGHTAVFDFELLKQGKIGFGQNSWRGDVFEEEFANFCKEQLASELK